MGIKYSVNENFFEAWSSEMAYTLGFWFADGSIEHAPAMRGKYIRVGCTDREIIESIKKAMSSEHKIIETKRPGRKTYYLLRIGNAKLFESIKKLGVTERKSLTNRLPAIHLKYLGDFVRGYFDGDGCAYIDKTKSKEYRRLSTIFTSGSEEFLLQLKDVLTTHNDMSDTINITKTRGGFSQAFQLRYSTSDSKKLYNLMYSQKTVDILLSRKKNIFEEFFQKKSRW
jgi:hypothetical protein